MGELIRFELEDGGSVVAEVADSELGIARASRVGDAILSATASFEAALTGVRDAAGSALRHFKDIPQPPDEVTLEFGVQLSAQAGAVIAQTAAAGHMQVTLTWQRSGFGTAQTAVEGEHSSGSVPNELSATNTASHAGEQH